jgi:hypothetical protein
MRGLGMDEEDEIEITVEIKDKEPCGESNTSSQNWEQYSYLGDLEEAEKEQKRSRTGDKKRKKEEEEKIELKLSGLKSSPGWEEGSKMAMNDARWQRKIIDKCSEGRKVERIENVAIVDDHDLGTR